MALAVTASPPFHLPTASNSSSSCHHHHHRLVLLTRDCSNMSQLKQIHARTLRTTSTQHPDTLFLYSRIVHFSVLSDLDYASRLLHQIENPNSFIWNTLIRSYAWSVDRKDQAIVLYRRMVEEERVVQDKHTFPFVLKACAFLFAISEGEQIHTQIVKLGFVSDTYVNNSLIHFYSTCGCLDIAQKVFERMSERSLVSWNVMIDGFVQFGDYVTALRLFGEMQNVFEPDGFTMQSVVRACAGLGAFSLGMWAHAYVLRKCSSDVASDVCMNNSLLDMYCKCGSIGFARQVFERMPKRDVTSWNSMILGYSMHGQVEAALEAFACMCRKERFKPNSITFVGVLSACNHGGLVSEGRRYFDLMVSEYKIEPQLEHYGCMVDLVARAGLIDEALNLVSDMHMKPDMVIWRSLLDACCKNNASVELSEEVARQVLESEGGIGSGVYVLLSRVYASASRWNEVGLVRKLMSEKGIIKEPGCSSLEVDGVVHQFLAGDTSHPQTKEIYRVLDVVEERLESVGYVPDLSQAPMVDELDDEKQHSLRLHSERLAIAFGLLNVKPGVPIPTGLTACAYSGALQPALADMYAKCGCIDKAAEELGMSKRNIFTWATMIGGFVKEAIHCFERMQEEDGRRPDGVVILGVLMACTHAGFVEEGLFLLNNMESQDNVVPKHKHYSCTVDLQGRSLLNIYMGAWRSKDACRIQRMMDDRGMKKTLGFGVIELDGEAGIAAVGFLSELVNYKLPISHGSDVLLSPELFDRFYKAPLQHSIVMEVLGHCGNLKEAEAVYADGLLVGRKRSCYLLINRHVMSDGTTVTALSRIFAWLCRQMLENGN
ncbi:hypothetical protein HHK36_029715 [Tetracentron sinense]|uniref:Uncharacterized protein n=1 Tax=Tetracentron sinense TaxID=13715 RepID=A0A834YEF6_TETSI|nr:hypothetical protein HHK36_029715 [Tetracentron sinense]